jgi:hypothetical protein
MYVGKPDVPSASYLLRLFKYRRDRGTKIMFVPRQGNLGRGARTPDLRVAFNNHSCKPRRGKDDCCRQAVGPGTDDGGRFHTFRVLRSVTIFLSTTSVNQMQLFAPDREITCNGNASIQSL